jgi:hypothetical protein
VIQPREVYSTYRELLALKVRIRRLERIALLLIAQVPPDAPEFAELHRLAEDMLGAPHVGVERNDLP